MGSSVTAGEMLLVYLSNFLFLGGWMRDLRAERLAALMVGECVTGGCGVSVPLA